MCACISLNSKFVSFLLNDRSLSSGNGQEDGSKPRFHKIQGSQKQASSELVVMNKKEQNVINKQNLKRA